VKRLILSFKFSLRSNLRYTFGVGLLRELENSTHFTTHFLGEGEHSGPSFSELGDNIHPSPMLPRLGVMYVASFRELTYLTPPL